MSRIIRLCFRENSLSHFQFFGYGQPAFALGFDSETIQDSCLWQGKRLCDPDDPSPYPMPKAAFYYVPIKYNDDYKREPLKGMLILCDRVIRRNGILLNNDENCRAFGRLLSSFVMLNALASKDRKFENEHEMRVIILPNKSIDKTGSFIRQWRRIRRRKSELVPYISVSFSLEGNDAAKLPLRRVIVGPCPDPDGSVGGVRALCINHGYPDVLVEHCGFAVDLNGGRSL